MAATDVDLEVILGWIPEADGFRVNVLYNAPGDHDDYRYFGRDPVQFDLDDLDDLDGSGDIDAYGRLLGEILFKDSARALLDKALYASRTAPVHLRLVVDPKAPADYQQIRWETICQPESDVRLTINQNIRFSRFMASPDGSQPTPLARVGTLKALVAVANPANIGTYVNGPVELADIAVQHELERARTALAHMDLTELSPLAEHGRRATRANITAELRKGIHMLYLVCHGRFTEGRPELLLENDEGLTDEVGAAEFAEDFAALERKPTVVVLCSCESAGSGNVRAIGRQDMTDVAATAEANGPAGVVGADAISEAGESEMSATARDLAAVGPALARAGAAVVVAMQGNVTMKTAQRFLPEFFRRLNEDGVPARAMAAARLEVRDRPDWYMPVLYSRLKRGSTWYLERFGGREAQLFANLHTRMRRGFCTPIVGSGIAGEDGVLPSRQELADQWVTRRQMPISDVSRSDLATVAQFVRVEQEGGVSLVRDEMHFLLLGELKERHQKALPNLDFDNLPLHELVGRIGRHKRTELEGRDGYSRLARLGLSVYVTTSWTGLLEDALREQGRPPVVRFFDWRKSTSERPWPYEVQGNAAYVPGFLAEPPADSLRLRQGEEETRVADVRQAYAEAVELDRELSLGEHDLGGEDFTPERPLVYHLTGTLRHERTLVLTEDDYFTWLQEWMKQVDNGSGIPGYVKLPLITYSQLFLGYNFDDWEFRMMFQAIRSFQRRASDDDDDGPHVGVQLEPTTLRIEREAAQTYLESYFGVDRISIYWQSCNDFLSELDNSRPR
jgi:hypothetical protein